MHRQHIKFAGGQSDLPKNVEHTDLINLYLRRSKYIRAFKEHELL